MIVTKRNSKVSIDNSAPFEDLPENGVIQHKELLHTRDTENRRCLNETSIVSAVPRGSRKRGRRGCRALLSSMYTYDYSSFFRKSAIALFELISSPAANGKRSILKRRGSAVQPEEPTITPNNIYAASTTDLDAVFFVPGARISSLQQSAAAAADVLQHSFLWVPPLNSTGDIDSQENGDQGRLAMRVVAAGDRRCDKQGDYIRSGAIIPPSLPTRSSLMLSQPQRRRFSLSCSPISEERRAIRLRPAARVVVDSTTGQQSPPVAAAVAARLSKDEEVTAAGAYAARGGGRGGVESYPSFTSRAIPTGARRRSAPSGPAFSHRSRNDDDHWRAHALSIRRRHADLSSGLIVSPSRSKGGVASGASSTSPSPSLLRCATASAACVSRGVSSSHLSSAAVGFGTGSSFSSASVTPRFGLTFLQDIEIKMATLALKSPFRGGEGAAAKQQQELNNVQPQEQEQDSPRPLSPPLGLQLRFLVVEDPFYDGPKTKTVDTLIREGQIVAKANGEFECLRMVREAASKKVPFDVVLLDLDLLLASSAARCAKVIDTLRNSLGFKGAIFCLLDVKLTTLRTMQKLMSSGADFTLCKPLFVDALAKELALVMKRRASFYHQITRSSSNSPRCSYSSSPFKS